MMFASSGYFRGVSCPFFANGLCERHYCHFRHVKSAEDGTHPAKDVQARLPADGGASSSLQCTRQPPSLIGLIGPAVRQVQRDGTHSRVHSLHAGRVGDYNPTPIAASRPVNQVAAGKPAAVEYKPTPLNVLRKMHESKQRQLARNDSALEYNPLTNFSTRQTLPSGAQLAPRKAAKRKSDEVSKVYTKRAKPTDDGEVVAKFSDDEDSTMATAAKRVDESQEVKTKENVVDESKSPPVEKKAITAIVQVDDKENHVSCAGVKVERSDETSTAGQVVENDDNITESESTSTSTVKKPPRSIFDVIKCSMNDSDLFQQIKKETLATGAGCTGVKCELVESEPRQKVSGSEQTSDHDKLRTDDTHTVQETVSFGVEFNKPELMCIKSEPSDGMSLGSKEQSGSHSASSHKSSSSEHKKTSHGQHKHHSSRHHHHSSSSASKNHSAASSHKTSSASSNVKKHTSLSDSADAKESAVTVAATVSATSSHKSHDNSATKDHLSSSHTAKKEHSSSAASHTSNGTKKRISSSHTATKKEHASSKSSSAGHTSSRRSSSSNGSVKKHVDRKEKASSHSVPLRKSPANGTHKDSDISKRHHSKHHSSSKRHKSSRGSEKKAADCDHKSSASLPNGEVDKALASHSDLFGQDSDSSGGDVICMHSSTEKTKLDRVIEISDDSDCDTIKLVPDEYSLPSLSDDDEMHTEGVHTPKMPERMSSPQNTREEEKNDYEGHEVTTEKKKKRLAHSRSTDTTVCSRPSVPRPMPRPTPAQVMQNRLKQMADRQNQVPSGNTSLLGSSFYKRRRTEVAIKSSDSPVDESTTGGTPQRVAHAPKQKIAPRPLIAAEFGSKVATNIRQRYLNLMIDETLKIYPTNEEAYERAVTVEKTVYERCTSRNIYLNLAVNAIKKLRSEMSNSDGPSPKGTSEGGCSHAVMLGGAKAAQTSFTLKRSANDIVTEPAEQCTGAALYKSLCKYLASEEDLVKNGYPQPSSENDTTAVLDTHHNSKIDCTNSERKTCCRCGKPFIVSAKGHYAKLEECVYHWGKSWKRRVAGSIENRYTCCQGDLNSTGCAVAKFHVQDTNKYSDLTGYVHTLPTSSPPEGDYGVYSLDCEMIYTTKGCELARVTVIGADLQPVYDQLVKPDHKIVDYNTRFSGITTDDMRGVTTTITDVQSTLTSMFSERTILIGHSLESDLIALKLIHKTVIDTSLVFPHRLGLPYKRALRNLMSEILQKIIQNDEGGHDSKEDAVACMQLMLWKLKEDAKKKGRHS